ncbi:MAG: hypothetical protein HOO86_17165 [Bacteroidales bacterium]|nr:hypothetical protein [Bacteroidales bacterium]
MKRYFFKTVLICSSLFIIQSMAYSQGIDYQNRGDNRWVLGGDFGLGFSTYSTNITVSPQIGYRITTRWEFGTRLTYNYFKYKDLGVEASTHNYGGGLYTIFDVYRGLFLQAENEILSYEKVFWGSPDQLDRERILVHSIFVGGGYRQLLSENSFVSITILYNLNETLDSPYDNPLIRIGFGFGL